MKVKTVYQCEKCGQEYSDPDDCAECEKRHFVPVRINTKMLHYRSPLDTSDCKYPTKIRIEMENGDIVTYYSERSPEILEKYQESQ